jgi:peptide/nickel transport system substrate-binding protein
MSRRALMAGLAASGFAPLRSRAAEILHITWALPARIGKMDPVIADEIQTHVMSLTTETLMRFDDRGQPQPNLASLVDQPNATTYVYNLRPDIRFWDGSPLTAEDVTFSMQRQADPRTRGGWTAFYANVSDIEATSPLQVTVRLKEPDPAWRFTPCWGAARIFSKAQAQGLKGEIGLPDSLPLGTGPYRWAGFVPDEHVMLERNEAYWGDKPGVKALMLRFIVDESTRQLAMRAGEIDGASTVPLDQADQWTDIAGIHMEFARNHQVAYFGFNTEAKPFDDVHVRRAFAYCLDKAGLVKLLLGGHGSPAPALIPAEFFDVVQERADTEKVYAGLPQYGVDIPKAQAELAQSSVPQGFATLVEYPDSRKPIGLAALTLSESLKRIGVKLEVREVPTRQWRAKLDSFNYAMMVGTYSLAYADPGALPYNFYHSRFIKLYAYNVGRYRNPEVDAPLDAQRVASEPARRASAMSRVLRIVSEDLPLLPLWYQDIGIATRNMVYADPNPWYSYQDWPDRLQPA